MQKTTYNQQGAKELQQDNQYEFPYHYLPKIQAGAFTQHAHLHWGYEYYSYVQFVTNIVITKQLDSLIDIGCGDGRLLYELQKAVPTLRVKGIDSSYKAINVAKAMNPSGEYECSDIGKDEVKTTYSAATLIETMEHINPENLRHFLESIHKYLDPSGMLIITVPSTNLPVSKKHFQHFTLKSIEQYLDGLFTIDEAWHLNAKCLRATLIQGILCNRFFLLEWKPIRKWLYNYYVSSLLPATAANGMRICVRCTKV